MGCPVLDCLCTCQQQTQHPEVLVGGYSFGVGWGNFYMGINSWKYYCWEWHGFRQRPVTMFPGAEDVHALGGIGVMGLLDTSCLLYWFSHLEHDFLMVEPMPGALWLVCHLSVDLCDWCCPKSACILKCPPETLVLNNWLPVDGTNLRCAENLGGGWGCRKSVIGGGFLGWGHGLLYTWFHPVSASYLLWIALYAPVTTTF